MMMHVAKHQKTEVNGFALLSSLLLKHILDYLTNLGFCRAVSKEGFLPDKYAKSAVFLPNSLIQDVNTYLYRKRHITSVTFDSCAYLNSQMLSAFTYYQTAVSSIVVKRCPNVNVLPFDDIIEDNGTSFVIRRSGRNIKVEFQGCWELFDSPTVTMSPKQILDIAMSCFNAGTNVFHLLPFFVTSASNLMEDRDMFISFYNDVNFCIKDTNTDDNDASLLISTSNGLFICIMKKRADCWKIKNAFKKCLIPKNW